MKLRPTRKSAGRRRKKSWVGFWNRAAVVDPRARRRHRASLRRFLGLGLFWAGVMGLVWMAQSRLVDASAFQVGSVEITGLNHIKEEEILDRIEASSLDDIFRFDLSRLKRELLLHPWVEKVHIRKVFPNKLTIHVVERRPYMMIQDHDRLFLVDRFGVVLDQPNPVAERAGLHKAYPIITGLKLPETMPLRLSSEKGLRRAIDFLESIREDPTFKEEENVTLDVSIPGEIQWRWRGIRLRFPEEHRDEVWRLLDSVRAKMSDRKGSIHEIDLRFLGQVILR